MHAMSDNSDNFILKFLLFPRCGNVRKNWAKGEREKERMEISSRKAFTLFVLLVPLFEDYFFHFIPVIAAIASGFFPEIVIPFSYYIDIMQY